jgi:NADH:ubiquinone reductase (H+-translocating)
LVFCQHRGRADLYSTPQRLLIIGGGFAGLACAKELAGDARFEVTLVDRTNHHLFQPLLYQVATASLAAPDIARSIRQILADAPNVTVLMDEIRALDTGGRTATGASGASYPFDFLLLAAGARTSYFGKPEWARHALGLKSLADAQAIRRTVLSNLECAELSDDQAVRRRLMTVAIVGGGPTGVELAGAFADLAHRSLRTNFRRIDTSQLRIVLIEGSDRVLEAFDEGQSAYARNRLTTLGVEVWTGKRVDAIQPGLLHFTDGSELVAGAVIWGAGVEASPLTALLGVPLADRAGRVCPQPDLSLPGLPHVFVAGDIVRMKDTDGQVVPGVAPAASQMGRHVARTLKREATGKSRMPFDYLDKGIMAIIGKNHAVVKSGALRLRGFTAWCAWLFIHIAFLIGFRNRLAVLLGWAFAYLRNNPQARIIVHPPGIEPKG